MFEERKTATSRSYALRLFVGMPWAVRGFLILFNIILVALLVFGLIEVLSPTPSFSKVTSTLTELLKLVGGAVIGALSAHTKKGSERKDPEVGENERS